MNTPKLRFKEFSNNWTTKKLGEFTRIFSGNSPSTFKLNSYGIPFIKVNDLNFSYKYQNHVTEYVQKNEKITPFRSGTIIFPKRGAAILTNKIRIANFEMYSDTNIMGLEITEGDIEFFYYLLYKEGLYKIADTSTIPQINNKHIEPYLVSVPKLDEQIKISSFLQVIDKKVQLQQEKIDLLKEQKTGYMQKIFSRELRFKNSNGTEFPEWKLIKLNNFASKITNKNKDLAINNVISNSAKKGLISQKDYFEKEIANKDNIDGYYIISNGDFVYNPRISNDASYGPINIYREIEDGIVSPLYMCFSVKDINKEYLYHYFKGTLWHKYIYMHGDSGARHDRVSIKDSTFLEMPIQVPSIAEQAIIANFFSVLQNKIDLEEKKLEHLLNQKQAFMQQMFI